MGGTESFGVGEEDVYLIKTDSLGDTIWTKTHGGTDFDGGNSIAQNSDRGYIIAGYTYSFGVGGADVYLIRTDSLGDTLWTKTYGGTDYDEGCCVMQTSDEGYIIVAHTESFGVGGSVYLIRTDSLGDTIWTKTYGGSSWDYAYAVSKTSDSGYIIAGETGSFGAGCWDVYLIKTDPSGNVQWTKTYGDTSYDYGRFVTQTSDGGYIVAGYTESFGAGLIDIYLIKTDSLGDTIWTKTYGGTGADRGYSVSQTSDEGYIVAGHTESFGSGATDIYLIRTNSLGNPLWIKTYGGTNYDGARSVQLTADDGYIIVGHTSSFGAGFSDVYLIKTDSLGNVAGIEEAEERDEKREEGKQMTVYPNPFTTSTTINLPSTGHRAESIELKVYDASGRLVKSVPLTTNHLSLGTDLSPGIYFLKADGVNVEKVVKVR